MTAAGGNARIPSERTGNYVAITRARRQVILLTDGGAPPEFVTESIDGGHEGLAKVEKIRRAGTGWREIEAAQTKLAA